MINITPAVTTSSVYYRHVQLHRVYVSTTIAPPVRKDEHGNQRLDLPANALGKDNH